MLSGLRRLFKLTRTTVVLLVVVFTLGFNLLTFAFAPLANLMLAAAQRFAIQPVLAAASELATARDSEKAAQRRAAMLEADRKAALSRSEILRRELDVERRKAAGLAEEVSALEAQLKSANTQLSRSRRRMVEVTDELNDLRGARALPKTAIKRIDGLTARIVQRAGINAARNLASMPLESLPVVGALTIVSVTALEVHDACQTASDMEELRRLANLPEVDASIVRKACAKIPTLDGLGGLTLAQCREHEGKVLAELGPEAAAPIKHKCDCLELPDGCPGEDVETVRVPPPKPEMP